MYRILRSTIDQIVKSIRAITVIAIQKINEIGTGFQKGVIAYHYSREISFTMFKAKTLVKKRVHFQWNEVTHYGIQFIIFIHLNLLNLVNFSGMHSERFLR